MQAPEEEQERKKCQMRQGNARAQSKQHRLELVKDKGERKQREVVVQAAKHWAESSEERQERRLTPLIFFYKVIYPTILIAQAQLTSLNFLHKLTTCIIPFYFCNLLMELPDYVKFISSVASFKSHWCITFRHHISYTLMLPVSIYDINSKKKKELETIRAMAVHALPCLAVDCMQAWSNRP